MSSIETLHVVFFVTGFTIGFGHCIGMCGPIVVSISLNLGGRGVWGPNLLYHTGRVTTYAILGGVMGATGAFVQVTADIAGLQKGVMIFAGVMIVAMGLGMSGWIPMGKIFGDYYNPEGVIARGFHRLTRAKSMAAYFPLGLLLGLLPCGPVYTALIAAARTGMETPNALKGVLSGTGLMVAFGTGTIPALLIVARLAGMDWLRSRAVIYRTGSMLMIVVGVYYVVKGIKY